jgi:hypothetical protein
MTIVGEQVILHLREYSGDMTGFLKHRWVYVVNNCRDYLTSNAAILFTCFTEFIALHITIYTGNVRVLTFKLVLTICFEEVLI